MEVAGQRHAPAALPPGKTRYPLYRRLGGPQSRSGEVRKISPPPGFDPRTVQPVANRYTDYAILLIHRMYSIKMERCTIIKWNFNVSTNVSKFHEISRKSPERFSS